MGDGLKTALALLDGTAEPLSSERQLDLLADDEPDADLPLVASAPSRPGPKGGRPVGRRNRSTDQWVAFIQSRYRSPLVGLAETWSRSVRELAKELELYRFGSDGKPVRDAQGEPQLDLVRAFQLQQSAMVNALPYLHQRMPQAVQVEAGKSAGVILFNIGDAPHVEGDALTLNLQDYQEVNDAHAEASDAEKVGQ